MVVTPKLNKTGVAELDAETEGLGYVREACVRYGEYHVQTEEGPSFRRPLSLIAER